MQVHDPVGGQLRILVRLIADQPLTADDVQVRSEYPRIGDLIFAAELETEVRDAGYVIAWNHKDIAVGIGERIKRRLQGQCVLEGGIDVGVVCIEVPAILFVGHIGFDALTERIAGVLKELVP